MASPRHRVDRGAIGLAPGAPVEALGQDERKYSSTNPVVRALIDRWLGALRDLVAGGDGVVIDVGVGEGLALEHVIGAPAAVVGVEYREDKVRAARCRVDRLSPVVADAGLLPLRDSAAGVTTCVEVLEHLVRPDLAVAELARITNGRCVVSVPWEPWFRAGNLARGKNVGRLGNDPEHVGWFTPRRLRRLLESGFEDVTVRTCFPWILAVARRPRPAPRPRRG
jgi:SAM-dependent methyltransferase